jgi:hypothetical protein
MKIVALNGLLGYGYTLEAWQQALACDPDIIGVDAGSIDPGPHYLGSGTSFTDRFAVKRDLALALPEAIRRKIPFIIGTAGGSGASPHVDWLCAIIDEIARENQLTCRYAVIRSDISSDYVLEKHQQGKVHPLGPLTLDEEKVRQATHIVAQMSIDPFIRALDLGVDLIIAGRACDTAIYAAPAIRAGFDPGLAYHMAKIMECGSLCSDPASASDVMLGEIGPETFTLTPMNPARRCTVERVAAHTLYEQENPYLIREPDGTANVQDCQYEQVDARTVRVTGSRFLPAVTRTLKLEGSRLVGYRAISIAGINDPMTISRIDELFTGVKAFITENQPAIAPDTYQLHLKKYGGILADPDPALAAQMAIIIDVVGQTQDIAGTICSVARSRLLHFDYPGRRSTAGNLAFPYSPSDIKLGPVYGFCLYHVVEVADLMENIKITLGGYQDGQPV